MNRPCLEKKRRIVIKVGSSSLAHKETGDLYLAKIEKMVREICDLRNSGIDVCLVSSGAIAVGKQAMGLKTLDTKKHQKQACAAIGQARLMMIYQRMFSEYNQNVAQILMTKNTMTIPNSRKNAKNTFDSLFNMGVIPIVNENDTVSTYEMKIGDNDTLSALVTTLIGGDLLVLLSDIDGMYTDDPNVNKDAQLIEYVANITDDILAMGKNSTGSNIGTGGMETKLRAAQISTYAGADMIIINSNDLNALHHLFDNSYRGTLFAKCPNSNFSLEEFLSKDE